MEMSRVGVPIKCPNCDVEFVVVPTIEQITVQPESHVVHDGGNRMVLAYGTVAVEVRFATEVIGNHSCEGWQG